MQELYQDLKKFGKVKVNEPLAKHTTFKIGGPADFLVIVESVEALVGLLDLLNGRGVDYFLLGGGSNMLASDEGYRGVVIKMQSKDFKVKNDNFVADAGLPTVFVAQESMKAGLSGFEWGVGVPGTIGGAVRGNAGAMGSEMGDVVSMVEVYRDGEVIGLEADRLHFYYRHSIFKLNNDVILRVHLKLLKTDNKDLLKNALEHLKYRNKTQPQGWSSTGCIFKNIELLGEHGEPNRLKLLKNFGSEDEKIKYFLKTGKISAGWLIEQAGLKNKQIGQVEVSDKHCNFVVNVGGAKAVDVVSLIEHIKTTVYDKYGIELEEEIQFL